MAKVLAVIGARPQFIKHYPFEVAAKGRFDLVTVHTGQHYDQNMSQIFFDQLGMSKPDYQLQAGGGSHGAQTGRMMIELEEIILKEQPDAVVVYGDTNSTLAGALVASKLHIPIVHIEAGLRSFNRNMPEEINRILTDHISALLFVPSQQSVSFLAQEGIIQNVHIVGDIMKDMVMMTVNNGWLLARPLEDEYYFATIHRPYNTDEKERLLQVLSAFQEQACKVVFAIHPRTRKAMETFDIAMSDYTNVLFVEPQPYFENLTWLYYSQALITDSGGMQKEAYWLQKKCVTVRSETEWVETLENGNNVLVFNDLTQISDAISAPMQAFSTSLYGDGNAARQMVEGISQLCTINID